MNPAHECLYDVRWQLLRCDVSTKWDTEEDTRAAISRLLTYIHGAENRYWKFIRVWRCFNYVPTAVATAEARENFGGLKLLKTFRKGLEIEYNRYRHAQPREPFRKWSWEKVGFDLTKLYEDDRDRFNKLLAYEEQRMYRGGKQDPTQWATRPELLKFVRMARDVEFEHG